MKSIETVCDITRYVVVTSAQKNIRNYKLPATKEYKPDISGELPDALFYIFPEKL